MSIRDSCTLGDSMTGFTISWTLPSIRSSGSFSPLIRCTVIKPPPPQILVLDFQAWMSDTKIYILQYMYLCNIMHFSSSGCQTVRTVQTEQADGVKFWEEMSSKMKLNQYVSTPRSLTGRGLPSNLPYNSFQHPWCLASTVVDICPC